MQRNLSFPGSLQRSLLSSPLWIALHLLVGSHPCAAQREHTLTGNFQTYAHFHSRFLERDRDILIYLPPGYSTEQSRRYPVFYLHDGQNLFDGATSFLPGQEWRADETAQALIQSGEIEPIILVGIYNTADRMAEYTPTKAAKYGGGLADRYGLMLTSELKPWIDRTFRTRAGRTDTALGGSSLGGLVSLALGLKYPQTFGKLALLSPSVWWDHRAIVHELLTVPVRLRASIWLDIGTREGEGQDQVDTLDDARLLRDALIARGWHPGSNLAYVEAQGAGHNEHAWAARFPSILKFLFHARCR